MTTLKLHEETVIPVRESRTPGWLKAIVAVIVTSLLTGVLTTWANSSGQDVKIETNTNNIRTLYQTKANREDIDRLERRLDKIENKQDSTNEKLDKLIGKMEKR